MRITPTIKTTIVTLLRHWYPDWGSVNDPLFQEDEVLYKREAMKKAQNLIRQKELAELLDQSDYDEFMDRLDKTGKLTNQLWLAAPRTGDLRVLYHEGVDRAEFCSAVFDLLYGDGSGEVRLGRYCEYLSRNDLPNYWTFPTYLLYYSHPDSEIFVKPSVTQWWLKFMDSPMKWSSTPSPELYEEIKRIAGEITEAFQDEGATDMVDAQSIMWTVARAEQEKLVTPEKQESFEQLFSEFLISYPQTKDGQKHIEIYSSCRDVATANYEEICRCADAGEDVTDAVLLKLLPHEDSEPNRDAGAWIHWTTTIKGDIKKLFEAKGFIKQGDWPAVSAAILSFVRRCMDNPEELVDACEAFSAQPYSTGFQAATLTPILNALRPDDFALINNKQRIVLNHFAGTKFSQGLEDYPKANDIIRNLQLELASVLVEGDVFEISRGDLFDMFSDWLVAVRQYEFPNTQYWKISPSEQAWPWSEYVEGGFIAIGWDELGDIENLKRTKFNNVQRKCGTEFGWTHAATEQVWKFAKHIQEGDRILANRGTSELLGIGTVAGPYYYVEGAKQAHRLPVEWDDVIPREIEEGGWSRTLIKLDRGKFEELVIAPPLKRPLAKPFSDIFTDRDEAEWAFGFMHRSLDLLGVEGPDDPRCALTLPKKHDNQLLRFNFGNWLMTDFWHTDASKVNTVDLALLTDYNDGFQYKHWGNFSSKVAGELEISVHQVPVKDLRPMSMSLDTLYRRTFELTGKVFEDWNGTPYRHAHQQQIMDAVFDNETRDDLLTNGLEVDDGDPDKVEVNTKCPFSQQTFSLLEQLNQTPTAAFYQGHKQEFVSHVEEPFKRVLLTVAERLPQTIRSLMETEHWIFSKFLKNDFGRGGAWSHYWGAFYPKGSKRSQDAQLSMWMNYQYLDCGFFIGHYGSEQRQRFESNCRKYGDVLKEILADSLDSTELLFGARDTFTVTDDGSVVQEQLVSWQDFLNDPDEHYPDVSVVIPARELLQMSESELVDRVLQTHTMLFPLVLLAIEDDPLPAIEEYLQVDIDGGERPLAPVYLLSECAAETGFSETELADWARAIKRKGQAIFYGPPGTGKTYIARKLAAHLIGGGDGFTDLVQFHPAYSYEDFVQGIRPQSRDGQLEYPVVAGRFLEFCSGARQRKDPCVLIVDEINRANLAQVFGELMYLLEYREDEIPLAGSSRRFSIPENVYILGTMNTADRSIALVDHALRRRFAFLALYPNYDVLEHFHTQHETGFPVARLVEQLRILNNRIGDKHYSVGISFFLRPKLREELRDIWRAEIEPYLDEYFFDNPQRAEDFRWEKVASKVFAES